MVIGAGSINMSDQALKMQTMELLGRTLTAIEDLDSWSFCRLTTGSFPLVEHWH